MFEHNFLDFSICLVACKFNRILYRLFDFFERCFGVWYPKRTLVWNGRTRFWNKKDHVQYRNGELIFYVYETAD